MVTFATFEKITLNFPEITVETHFEKISFRIKKKIFATYDAKHNRVTVKLSEIDQNNFSSLNSGISPVNNKWGEKGWTFIALNQVNPDLLLKVLTAGYCEVAPKKLSELIKRSNN